MPRRKDEPGKGGFWRINPEYSDMFVNGIFKKRRNSARENIAPAPKRMRREVDDMIGVASMSPSRQMRGMQIKSEPQDDRMLHVGTDDFTDTLNGEFNWNAILHQDIDVGGVRIKTEDLIDGSEDQNNSIASPITTLSPPPSDSNSDTGFDELFATEPSDDPLDLSGNGDPLDLSVQGFAIKPPDWWSESMTRGLLLPLDHNNESGLHTPIAPSPVPEHELSHPWAENRSDLDEAIASFDLDLQNLFEDDSLSNNPSLDS